MFYSSIIVKVSTNSYLIEAFVRCSDTRPGAWQIITIAVSDSFNGAGCDLPC